MTVELTARDVRDRRIFLGLQQDELGPALWPFRDQEVTDGRAAGPASAETVRGWERGKGVPMRVGAELDHLEEVTREVVEMVADWIRDGDEVSTAAAPEFIEPRLRGFPGWWRMVVMRARETVIDS